ncbi:MAG: substrate-binding domain-containing protein [Spirochaetales bacterium]|nr:substrate-binding domain-containing protein [Spirochaetales bacterium]
MKSSRDRLCFGYFCPKLDGHCENRIWAGVADYAASNNIDLICFPGEGLRSSRNFEYQANVLYELARGGQIDGLIIHSKAIGATTDQNLLTDFCLSYHPLPVVSIGFQVQGIACVQSDNSIGMRQLLDHLITYHQYRYFAFINGPETGMNPVLDYLSLSSLLKEHAIEFQPQMIYNGNFHQESGAQAVEYFLSIAKLPVDVIVAANDAMALGAMEALQAKGVSVPGQLAVVGFDNISSSRYCTPPLTSVSQPNYELGRQSIALLHDRYLSRPGVKLVQLASHLVIRQSCGCFHHDSSVASFTFKKKAENRPFLNQDCVLDILLEPASQALDFAAYRDPQGVKRLWIESLVRAFFYDLEHHQSDSFITTLNDLLRLLVIKKRDIFVWHKILTILVDCFLNFELERPVWLKAQYLWDKARVLIGEVAQRNLGYELMESERLNRRLWEIGNALIASFDLEKLMEVLDQMVKALEIEFCVFSVYCDIDNPLKNARLLYLFTKQRGRCFFDNDYIYPSNQIVPLEFQEQAIGINMIVLPLFFQTEQLGFVCLHLTKIDSSVFDVLRQQISSTLKGAGLMREIRDYANRLEDEVDNRTRDLIATNHQLEKEIEERQKVDKALKESELNLRAITEATPIPLAIINLSTGSLLYANIPFCRCFGINERDLGQCKIQDFLTDPLDQESLFHNTSSMENQELQVLDARGRSFSVIASFQHMTFLKNKAILCGFYDITERKRLEREILEISGREQRRIGQDLHDDLCQSLAGIAVMISALANNLMDHDEETAGKALEISTHINDAIARTRSLARGLYPAALEENGLAYMLRELAQKIKMQFRVQCEIIIREIVELTDISQSLHLYRICQEAVNNAIHHGQSSTIIIEFISTAEKIYLAVRDNGLGFPKNLPSERGMGLRIMHYRANIIGAKINIKKNGKKGTCLSCTINRK